MNQNLRSAITPETTREAAGDAIAILCGVPPNSGHHPLAADLASASFDGIVAALTNDDFGLSSADGFGQVITLGYAVDNAHRKICREVQPSNFQANKFTNADLGLDDARIDAPTLEGGEGIDVFVKSGIGDPASLKKKTITLAISPDLVKNDIGAATYVFNSLGAILARRERRAVFFLLTNNPTLPDARLLFNSTDANDLGAGALSLPTLGAGFAAMRRQKTLAGNESQFRPKFLVVAPEVEILALSLAKQITVDGNAQAIEVLVANEIIGDAWYLVADPNQAPALGFLALVGSLGRTITTRAAVHFRSSAPMYAVDHTFGTTVLGRVGLVRGGV